MMEQDCAVISEICMYDKQFRPLVLQLVIEPCIIMKHHANICGHWASCREMGMDDHKRLLK